MAKKLSRRSLARFVVDQIQAGTSEKLVAKQLAGYLVDHRRTKELPLIIRDIEYTLMQRGKATATVTSAFPLSQSAIESVKSLIKEVTSTQSVELLAQTDQSVLGGIKLELPGSELDDTIARKLTSLRTNYKKA